MNKYTTFQSLFWRAHEATEFNPRQRALLTELLAPDSHESRDSITVAQYASRCRCSMATARRDISDLVSKGCLIHRSESDNIARYAVAMPSEDSQLETDYKQASEEAFRKVWDNPEDADYDSL